MADLSVYTLPNKCSVLRFSTVNSEWTFFWFKEGLIISRPVLLNAFYTLSMVPWWDGVWKLNLHMSCVRATLILANRCPHVTSHFRRLDTHSRFDEVGHFLLLRSFAPGPPRCHALPTGHTPGSFGSSFSHQLVRLSVPRPLLHSLCS